MKRTYAADIKPGDAIADCFRVVEARLAPYRDESKGHYLHLVLADRSGQVEARLWEDAQDAAQWLAAGDVALVKARAALYQERIRLRVESIEPPGDDAPEPAELLAAPLVDVAETIAVVHGAIGHMRSSALRRLLQSFFGDGEFVEAFSLAPVERPGELLGQTVELLELAAPLRRLAEQLDHDLLTAAILLHGMGSTAALRGGTGARSVAWLGVAALSDQLLVERLAQMPDFPTDLALRLRHAILAAHEPAQARTAEAAVLAALRGLLAAVTSKR
jgi:3'-5' exoribonuclease